MQLVSNNAIIATLAITAVVTAGITDNLNPFTSGTVLATLAVLSSLAMMRRWTHLRLIMSETMPQARR